MKLKPFYYFLSIVVLVADQLSKLWATARLKPISTIEIIPGYFRFSYATNRGVAFSLFADSQFDVRWVLAAISAAAAVFVAAYLLRTPPGEWRLNTSLALLLAGIAGNLIDRVRLGEVVDFIELHWRNQFVWPTFNIADSAICVGAALLALEMMREAKPNAIEDAPPPAIQSVAGEERAD